MQGSCQLSLQQLLCVFVDMFANNPLATFGKGRDNFFEKSNLCCKYHLWASEISMDVIRPPVNF